MNAMSVLHESLPAEERLQANWIVTEVAALLGCKTIEEYSPETPEVALISAYFQGCRMDVQVASEETGPDQVPGAWVLTLSRGGEYGSRFYEGKAFAEAADDVRRFAREGACPSRWLC